MKTALFAALAVAVLAPLPAVAQSLNDTHDLVWHPAGKTPMIHYRLKDRPACSPTAQHQQAGKTPLAPAKKCVADIAKTPAATNGAAAAQ